MFTCHGVYFLVTPGCSQKCLAIGKQVGIYSPNRLISHHLEAQYQMHTALLPGSSGLVLVSWMRRLGVADHSDAAAKRSAATAAYQQGTRHPLGGSQTKSSRA